MIIEGKKREEGLKNKLGYRKGQTEERAELAAPWKWEVKEAE